MQLVRAFNLDELKKVLIIQTQVIFIYISNLKKMIFLDFWQNQMKLKGQLQRKYKLFSCERALKMLNSDIRITVIG